MAVQIFNFGFGPDALNINVGDTVEWTITEGFHTATAGTPANLTGFWDSEPMNEGQSFKFTFTQAGTFTYFCNIHNSMRGTITVGSGGPGASSSPPPATPPAADTDDYGY